MVRPVQVLAVFIVFASVVPPYNGGCSKEKAYVAAMKSDLRNLTSAQEQQLAEHGVYAASQSALEFYVSAGVAISIGEATRVGWSATAVHAGTGKWCAVFVGDARLFAGVANAGAPSCWG